MMMAERIQALVHRLDVAGGRWLNYAALTVIVLTLALRYDTHCYRNFSSPQAMDEAQVGRHLAEGKGFSTDYIRPFDIYLLQKHNRAAAGGSAGTDKVDYARMYGLHPDLANPPLYPVILAGLFKLISPDWIAETHGHFWSNGGHFARYKPEFAITMMNQLLLLAAVLMTFFLARTALDLTAAWLSAILMLYSDDMWKFSVSGLPTMLLIVIFLGICWCLVAYENLGRTENPDNNRRFMLAIAAGSLLGFGMLTCYSFGWLVVPVVIFLVLYGGVRKIGLALAAILTFAIIVSPWIVRNISVSGTPFGTASFALLENSESFSGSRLMQSLNPEMWAAYRGIAHLTLLKLVTNLHLILEDNVPRLGGGWIGILFLAGLLLGLRNTAARRLRYFVMISLGVFIVIMALGMTSLSTISPLNTENLLVLISPLAIIFGVAFFLTLLNQMQMPVPQFRYAVIVLVVVLVRMPMTLALLPPDNSPVAYPPYYPPDVQKISTWVQPNELEMSDIPWAVAWYGNRQCIWTTLNCGYEFDQLNDYVKPVNGLYITLNTLDGKFFTDCVHGDPNNWGNFCFNMVAKEQLPNHFPLRNFPQDNLLSGFFLADHRRW